MTKMTDCAAVEHALAESGLLAMQDQHLRSVVGIITGERLKTSWWNHAKAQEIFRCLDHLGDSRDVLVSRLAAGKVTYVHRRLWPAFLSVAGSNEPWQRGGLSADAVDMLAEVEAGGARRAKGPAARELQERLLIAADEVHTEAGRHELELRSWTSWSKGRGVRGRVEPASARAQLEAALVAIGGTAAMLPWNRFGRTKPGTR
jgi:hypothetical protein